MGYVEPTPVQAMAIPVMLSGRDALVEAETGSGKTTAFGIPAVVAGSGGRGIRVLILVPTRELARQVNQEIRELGAGSPFRSVAVTGGVSEEMEERALGGDVRCVVGTPGRILALIEEGKLRVDKVGLLILDEADRMLDLGFRPDVEKVLTAATFPQRQTALFSATLAPGVIRLAASHLRDPADVRVGTKNIPESLSHHRLNVFAPIEKEAALIRVLRQENPERAMVFVRTRDRAIAFTKLLKSSGLLADQLQGKMTHDQRRHVFDLFSRGIARILVATDLASRGLDVPEMELVINVDVPDDDETYLHRSGRAARMGRPGRVITFVMPNEKTRRIELENEAQVTFTPYRLQKEAPPEPEPEAAPEPEKKKRVRKPKSKASKAAAAAAAAEAKQARKDLIKSNRMLPDPREQADLPLVPKREPRKYSADGPLRRAPAKESTKHIKTRETHPAKPSKKHASSRETRPSKSGGGRPSSAGRPSGGRGGGGGKPSGRGGGSSSGRSGGGVRGGGGKPGTRSTGKRGSKAGSGRPKR